MLVRNGVPIAWHAVPTNPTLVDVIGGLTNVFFAYGGNMAVFSFCSEMKSPQDFKKSFIIVQESCHTLLLEPPSTLSEANMSLVQRLL